MADATNLISGQNIDENSKTRYVHKFKEAFIYEDKNYTEICFDFTKLTGRDLLDIEEIMRSKRDVIIAPAFDADYQTEVAAKAAGIDSLMLELMPANDFLKITGRTRNFLLS